MKGCSSPYAVWSAMKKVVKEKYPPGKKPMAYINVNKRITELARMKLLEEIRPDAYTVNIHGRKDYKVTEKGLERLLPYMFTHTEDVKVVNEYMVRFGLNKQILAQVWVSWVRSALASTGEYLYPISSFGSTQAPMNMDQINQLEESVVGFHKIIMDARMKLRELDSKQTVKSKSSTGHNLRITSKVIKDGYDEYDEQVQRRMERGEPEIDDGELAENLYRMEKSRSTRQTKTIAPQKRRR